MNTEASLALFAILVFAPACGDSDTPATPDAAPSVGQTPPSGAAAVQAWLDAAHYQSWHCEAAPHPARAPSAHGRNRICNNDALHGATGDGPFPVGAASVKELFDDADQVIGHAVYRKDADGTDGSNWYWYEDMSGRVIADGAGDSGVARSICVDCHSHAPRDFVFTIAP